MCDLCGITITNLLDQGRKQPNVQLVKRFGDAFGVTVELKAGETNLDGGAGETTSFDICPICFADRLKPWLESQNAQAKVEPWHS